MLVFEKGNVLAKIQTKKEVNMLVFEKGNVLAKILLIGEA
jgi:hypothetical protein